MDRIDQYEILGEIARGGMGVVLRAREPGGEEVAIKLLLSAGQSSPDQLKRFEREAGALARLRHPNIVGVRQVGAHTRGPYLVMDLALGDSLAERLDHAGPLSPGLAATLTAKVARALEHAHQQGLLHRDVKPANIIVTPEGEPLLTDFGLAKDLDPEVSRLSRTGQYMGTPGFWPPEQARGDLAAIGATADVYSLGATLYALLTGEAPIDGESLVEILVATAERLPTPPSVLRPQVDAALERICMRCLEKDPARRYPSAAALGEALDAYLAGGGVAPSSPQRSRARLGVGAACLVALTALGVFAGLKLGAKRRASRVQAAVEAAEEAAKTRDFEGALAHLEGALALEPTSPDLLRRRAYLRELAGDLPGAEADQSLIIQLAPGPGPYQLRAAIREKAGDLRGALSDYDQVVALGGADPRIHTLRGKLYQRLGDRPAALGAYTAALEINSRAMEACVLRAKLREASGDIDGAIADCDHMLSVLPRYHLALNHRGRLRRKKGDLPGALEDFTQALRRYEDPENNFQRGRVLLEMGKAPEALGEFERALGKRPNHVGALSGRANAREHLGDLERATEDYRRVLELLSPEDPNARAVQRALERAERKRAER